MELSQQISFSYALADEPGSAAASLVIDGVESQFDLSNAGNPLADMLCALASLLANPSHLWGDDNKSAFAWFSESESYNWSLAIHPDGNLHVRVSQVCEFFGDEAVEIINAVCSPESFILPVVSAVDAFIKKIGLLNYLQLWQDEFPLSYFLFLKKNLIEKDLWQHPLSLSGEMLRDELQILMA